MTQDWKTDLDWNGNLLTQRNPINSLENGNPLPADLGELPESFMKLAQNPIHAFHLMKRMTVDWKYIGEHPPSEDWKGMLINNY